MSPSTPNFETTKLHLAREILLDGGSIRMRVWGTSMLPTLWPGDIVTVDSHPADTMIKGEIVLYETPERFFVHRLIEKLEVYDSPNWVIQGDSMPHPDPMVAASQILGRVCGIYRNGRTIIPATRLSFIRREIGRILCHSNRCRNLALRFHASRPSLTTVQSSYVAPLASRRANDA